VSRALTLRTWEVDTVVAGPETRLDGAVLQVAIEDIEHLARPPIAGLDVHIVAPGDAVRVTHVLDVVIPSVKVGGRSSTFPGIVGPATVAGSGITHRLARVGVVAVADLDSLQTHGAVAEGPSLIDMDGSGAAVCPFAAWSNVVLAYTLDPESGVAEADQAVRRLTLEVAILLAGSTIGADEPSRVVELPARGADPALPTIVAILQVGSEGTGNDTLLYGEPLVRAAAQTIDPAELLDGALVNAAYDYAGLRNVTAFYQENALVRELWAEHGIRLNFGGVVMTLAYLDDPEDKRAWAEAAAGLAASLGADGVIMTSYQSGNSHTDVMLTIAACEQRGIRTTAIVSETDSGIVDSVPEADALVSSGNEDELMDPWTPKQVIAPGASRFGSEHPRQRLPIVAYVGAVEQTGGSRVRAVTL